MDDRLTINFTLNGTATECAVPTRMTLAALLRDQLGLTGTKVSCELQVCGVCTVLVDGDPVSSCTYLAVDADGHDLTTIEGVAGISGQLHPIQQAFIDKFGMQCGFCTPGFVVMAKALLDRNPQPSRDDIMEWFEGNICRCTGYRPILEAVEAAARTLAQEDPR